MTAVVGDSNRPPKDTTTSVTRHESDLGAVLCWSSSMSTPVEFSSYPLFGKTSSRPRRYSHHHVISHSGAGHLGLATSSHFPTLCSVVLTCMGDMEGVSKGLDDLSLDKVLRRCRDPPVQVPARTSIA